MRPNTENNEGSYIVTLGGMHTEYEYVIGVIIIFIHIHNMDIRSLICGFIKPFWTHNLVLLRTILLSRVCQLIRRGELFRAFINQQKGISDVSEISGYHLIQLQFRFISATFQLPQWD